MTFAPPRLSFKQRLLGGAKRLLGMFLYLWVLFVLFNLHESIVLAKYQISYGSYGLAFVNAWVLAKVMLIAEDLNLGSKWFQGQALIYWISSRAVLFAVVFMCVHVVEEVLIGLWQGKTIVESLPEVGGGSVAGILSVAVILSVALIPFSAFKAINRALGPGVLRSLLLAGRSEELSSRTRAQPPET